MGEATTLFLSKPANRLTLYQHNRQNNVGDEKKAGKKGGLLKGHNKNIIKTNKNKETQQHEERKKDEDKENKGQLATMRANKDECQQHKWQQADYSDYAGRRGGDYKQEGPALMLP